MSEYPTPTPLQGENFAQMLLAGVPPGEAVRYFFPENTDSQVLANISRSWCRRREVTSAMTRLQGGNWLDMKPEERIKCALDKHYAEMAWFLYNNNYGDCEGGKKTKADTAREALEKKLAGTAGQMDPLARFYDDLVTGKLKKAAMPPAPLH